MGSGHKAYNITDFGGWQILTKALIHCTGLAHLKYVMQGKEVTSTGKHCRVVVCGPMLRLGVGRPH